MLSCCGSEFYTHRTKINKRWYAICPTSKSHGSLPSRVVTFMIGPFSNSMMGGWVQLFTNCSMNPPSNCQEEKGIAETYRGFTGLADNLERQKCLGQTLGFMCRWFEGLICTNIGCGVVRTWFWILGTWYDCCFFFKQGEYTVGQMCCKEPLMVASSVRTWPHFSLLEHEAMDGGHSCLATGSGVVNTNVTWPKKVVSVVSIQSWYAVALNGEKDLWLIWLMNVDDLVRYNIYLQVSKAFRNCQEWFSAKGWKVREEIHPHWYADCYRRYWWISVCKQPRFGAGAAPLLGWDRLGCLRWIWLMTVMTESSRFCDLANSCASIGEISSWVGRSTKIWRSETYDWHP